MPSHAVDHGISDTGVSKPVGTKTNHSAEITTEDLPTSNTIPSSTSTAEVKTNGSAEVVACVSAEGSCAQTVDRVHNNNPDKIDKLFEGKQPKKAL